MRGDNTVLCLPTPPVEEELEDVETEGLPDDGTAVTESSPGLSLVAEV